MGIINGSSEKQFLKDSINGASRLLNVCLIIAVAVGIGWILKESPYPRIICWISF
ncbi:hypothetical protein MmmBen181_0980 [Mycoplasma mycoides subsp. mycoides]|uniref:Uncharacterized protein n=1 Tax=Mycoplasma mycoides subsp. mycoides SC (strain CCUG 32753 / NCTC 10114 / PG1) TaxID=272632 RepID=Q6MS99_MYCMS|nr:hypothetical protein [Mycoplasma mycoides]QQY78122.1 hypothetical protein JLS56_04375 [Mycoplasma mycoides subsp. capri]CAE77491.1 HYPOTHETICAL PROTEIN MSC_0879 [Mycoplasma mycoides subsp. mycoides SC str. PG1]AME11044.1 hypothetical protein MmmBen_0910 [Mycoplasma mycoides subsp. mycoides]AME11054.1 hypothetical protein MmmBen_0921 [Mycoplasma mycoides subsp. mycoides]AME13099.1 hypothetical protein MmmBen181_0971 [Mycoplasma mycoides subsp. mycoides]